jgi:calmodulin
MIPNVAVACSGSGDLDAEEIVAAMRSTGITLSPEQAALLIAEADENGDGLLDFNEFVAMSRVGS